MARHWRETNRSRVRAKMRIGRRAGRPRRAALGAATALIAVILVAATAHPGAAAAEPDVAENPAIPESAEAYLNEALKEGTPEELEQRRGELTKRLEEAGTEKAFITQVEAEASAELAAIDAELRNTQDELVDQREKAKEATAKLADATAKLGEATDAAEAATQDLRDAAVDMFINPPEADGLRAALTGGVEEELASAGLLAGRAAVRQEAAERRDRAMALAGTAENLAKQASDAADRAKAQIEMAAADLETQLVERAERVAAIRTDLELLEEELTGLQLTDSILASRLAVQELAQSGAESGGQPVRGDMVRIPNTSVWVHHLIASAATEMFAAALADGVHMDGGGFRDPLQQIKLRMKHCGTSQFAVYEKASSSCSPPTARPGRSMHERGLAIDFGENGAALTRSSVAYKWLAENAARFGFFNLPSEPWHWSVNGH